MKKILSLILAGLMTVSCAAFVAADDAAVEATTNPVQDYAIEFLANCGVFKGGEGLTNEDLIERYQMALFVSRISTGWVEDSVWEDGTANDATFKDIDTEPANKYLGALSYANQNGIIEGYTANTFAPYASITYRDALTMVVRTLGYKGLSYPWGNIEKAVELGLTEGIDAAYTDELTRGEVAVIIYNAMFAKNSKGETLAKSIFGYDFGFQNIVVVNSDEYTTIEDKDGKKIYAPAGYVGFSLIDENGAIGSKVYYVDSDELGLTGHAEEQAVGEIFVALFTIENDLVDILDSTSLLIKTVVNNGITDNKGVAYETMPIAAELANYKLVKTFDNDYISYTFDDLMVYGYNTIDVVDIDGNAALVGIDSENNIVYYYGACTKTSHDDHKCGWEIEWYYNNELEKYYQYVVDDTNDTTGSDGKASVTTNYGTDYTAQTGKVFINWMTDAEFADWYNKIIKKVVATNTELKLQEAAATFMKSGKAPYSKLELYNIDADEAADVANYKEYSIGLFLNSSKVCGKNADGINHNNSTKYATYKITGLDGEAVYEEFVEEGHAAHENEIGAQFAWLTVDPSVTTFDATKAAAAGEVVLYDVNKTTGEIEIVKHITAGTNDDADSKIITGVLQAYSTSKKTITIDGTVYPINYANLSCDEYYMADTGVAERTRIGAELDEQYMQYVTAVICDGYVVDTDLLGEDEDFIVVLDYAGITSDGYIAVYGYSTDDLTLKVFKINTYNGWKKGDYRYYPENADEDDAFDFGTLYNIKSYDKATNSYGVYTENVDSTLANAKPVRITFRDGYRIVEPMVITYNGTVYEFEFPTDAEGNPITTGATVKKMSDADKYVVVTDDANTGLTSNIFTFTGKDIDDNDEFITGLLVDTKVDNKFVIYTSNAFAQNDNFAFFMNNAYQVGYVLYEKDNGAVLNAAYDEAIAGDFYLLGSSLSEVRVMNLLTGNRDAVLASSNIDLVNGHIYKTIGGQIIDDVTDVCNGLVSNVGDIVDNDNGIHNFVQAINRAYSSTDLERASYIVKQDVALMAGDIMSDKDTLNTLNLAWAMNFVANGMTRDALAEKYYGKNVDIEVAKELIKGITMYTVTDGEYDWYGNVHGKTAVEPLAWKDMDSTATYTMDLIYEVASGKIVAYLRFVDNNDDDKNDNIVSAPDSEPITGFVYDGKDGGFIDCTKLYKDAAKNANYEPKWTIKVNGKDRYFDVKVSYEAVAYYDGAATPDECLDLDKIELLSLTYEVVEMVPTTAGTGVSSTNPWKEVALPDCSTYDNQALHEVLAASGYCFGGVAHIDEEDMAAKTPALITFTQGINDVVTLTEDNLDIKYMEDCGLVYKVVVDLRDTVEISGDSRNVELVIDNAQVDHVVKATFVNAQFRLNLKAAYITAGQVDTFTGINDAIVNGEVYGGVSLGVPEVEDNSNADNVIFG